MAVMLIHAKLLQDFDIDYCFSVVRPELVEKNVTLGTYRYYHMDFGATLWRADKGERMDLWFIHNSRADLMRDMTLWMNSPG